MSLNYKLLTSYGKNFDPNNVLSEYPRPLMVRDSYFSLNGIWAFSLQNKKEQELFFDRQIVVPYVVEANLSGICGSVGKNDMLCYKKEFTYKQLPTDKTILHLDGVFQVCDVILNDVFLVHNEGGFKKIELDVSEVIKENNTLVVIAYNKPDHDLALSKEGHKRGGMWYTKTSGIYKSVWLESYNKVGIDSFKLETDIDGTIYGVINSLTEKNTITILDKGEIILKEEVENDFVLKLDSPKLWSPDKPNLYDVVIDNGYDKIRTYISFRHFVTRDNKVFLNGKEIFLNGVLYQAYFSDGFYTPASYKVFKDDILAMKKLGFNMMRMHIKLEADMFYYYADRYGMLVMQDFPNSGNYRYVRDSLLPTIFKHLPFANGKANKKRKLHFLEDGRNIIDYLQGYASVFSFTIFNEGWGQFEADKMYDYFKNYAPNYLFDTTSGWFKKKKSDFNSYHNYFFKLKYKKENKPTLLSEYGGYSIKIKDHIFNEDKEYGYKKYESLEEYQEALKELFKTIYRLKEEGLAGAIYTQVSDVEDEVNGLLTYDREVLKVTSLLGGEEDD